MYVCMYAFIYVCMYTYMYIYEHILHEGMRAATGLAGLAPAPRDAERHELEVHDQSTRMESKPNHTPCSLN